MAGMRSLLAGWLVMDDRTKRRLFVGFATTLVSKAASTVIQLVQVPVLMHFWGVTTYRRVDGVDGASDVPELFECGIRPVAGNEMTMLMARKEQDAALGVFQSCWWRISLVMGLTGVRCGGTVAAADGEAAEYPARSAKRM